MRRHGELVGTAVYERHTDFIDDRAGARRYLPGDETRMGEKR